MLPESISRLNTALTMERMSAHRARMTLDALTAHAACCRAKADTSGAAAEFFSCAAGMTRADRYYVANLVLADATAVTSAACEALHDLIMEGV